MVRPVVWRLPAPIGFELKVDHHRSARRGTVRCLRHDPHDRRAGRRHGGSRRCGWYGTDVRDRPLPWRAPGDRLRRHLPSTSYGSRAHVDLRQGSRRRGPVQAPCAAQDFDDWLKAIDNWGEGRSLTYFNPSRNDGPVYRQLYATFERAALTRGMARAAVASTLEIDVTAALKSVAAPTLVLHCSDDWMSIEAAKDIAAGIPSAHLVELDGADHAPFMGAASQEVLSQPSRVHRSASTLGTRAGAALRGNPDDRHRLVDEDGRSARRRRMG